MDGQMGGKSETDISYPQLCYAGDMNIIITRLQILVGNDVNFFHSSGLTWATYAQCHVIPFVTKASLCHHTLNTNHWHRLWVIPAIPGAKGNITTFNYVCRCEVARHEHSILCWQAMWGDNCHCKEAPRDITMEVVCKIALASSTIFVL